MTRATARTGRRPRTWAGSGWAGTARPTTGWSPSPRCGPMSGSITRCTRCRTPRPGTSPKGKNDPAFRTKLQIGADLAVRARAAGFAFRAVAADSAYGDQDGFRGELAEAGLPFVMALRPHRGTWARAADAHTPVDAARELRWGGPDDPGDWRPVTRRLPRRARRDLVRRRRHAWAGGARTAPGAWWWPPPTRAPCRTRPPGTWSRTWPGPAARASEESPWPAARLAEIVRIYGLRHWVEQSYKQVKDELGWADFQVRSDIAIRRHQVLVNCAFSFCWDAWLTCSPPPGPTPASPQERGHRSPVPAAPGMPGSSRRHQAGPAHCAPSAAG